MGNEHGETLKSWDGINFAALRVVNLTLYHLHSLINPSSRCDALEKNTRRSQRWDHFDPPARWQADQSVGKKTLNAARPSGQGRFRILAVALELGRPKRRRLGARSFSRLSGHAPRTGVGSRGVGNSMILPRRRLAPVVQNTPVIRPVSGTYHIVNWTFVL